MDAVKHSEIVLKYLRQQTAEVILFYSGGKDSIVLLDLLSKTFNKVHCVFMYFLKDLKHLQPYIDYPTKYYNNVNLIQLPHWMTSQYIKHNYFAFADPDREITVLKQIDIENKAKKLLNQEWLVFGHKKSDSLNRRLMLQTYKFDSINEQGKKIYPLALWNKSQVKNYIDLHNLIKPVEYGIQNSNGVELDLNTLLYLRKYYKRDLDKIFKVFPLSQKILFEHDYKEKNTRSAKI